MNYSINIVWSEEDEGFIATVPEFKNLSAFGITCEEALREAKDAIAGYIDTLNDEKIPVPTPATLSNYSGQTRIRMPKKLHQLLSVEAEREGVSLNTFMVTLLSLNYTLVNKQYKQKESNFYFFNINKGAELYPSPEEMRFSGTGESILNRCFNK